MKWLAVVLAGAALMAAGCSNGPTGPTGPTGTVTGSYIREGGPPGVGKVPLSGTISFQGPGGAAVTLTSDSTGKFTGQLPIGTYTVAASSSSIGDGKGPCSRPLTTHVQANKTVTITLICDIR